MPDSAKIDCAGPRSASLDATPRLATFARDDPLRAEVEAYIDGVFRERYDARIAAWAPTLVATCSNGQFLAAAGYRRATEALFLERYLDMPIEEAIAAHAGERVSRQQIFEVGHFASRQAGEGRRLMLLLGLHLARNGCRWVVSTATRELRALLLRTGLTPFALAAADPGRLAAGAADWGSYYDHAPVIVSGDLARSLAILVKRRPR